MTDKRQSKYKRTENPNPLALQDRDIAIIKASYEYRWISREQLQKLLNFPCVTRINIRLRKLWDNKLLSRRFLPTSQGSSQAIYSTGSESVDLLAQLTGTIKRQIKEDMKAKNFMMPHNLAVNDVRLGFELAVKKHPEMEWLRWINARELTIEYQRGKSFKPDGYFQHLYRGKLYSYFVEMDMSNESCPNFLHSKVAPYMKIKDSGIYQSLFRVKYFWTLIIVPSQERLINLKTAIEKVTNKMFWLTTFDKISPETVFKPIWHRVGREKLYSLVETK